MAEDSQVIVPDLKPNGTRTELTEAVELLRIIGKEGDAEKISARKPDVASALAKTSSPKGGIGGKDGFTSTRRTSISRVAALIAIVFR